jgi:hypothetical protein
MAKGNIKARLTVLAGVLSLLVMTSSPLLVAAHSPSSMSLEYDFGTQILTVTISHTVTNPASHYIENITVYKNDVKVASRLYTSQADSTTASDTISITAEDGDVLRVWAECVQGGTVQNTLTVSEVPTTTTTTTTDGDFPTTMVLLLVVVVLGIVMVLVKFVWRR